MNSVNYSGEYIPGAVRTALFLGLDILLDGWLPLLLVSLVDGVDLPPGLALKIQSLRCLQIVPASKSQKICHDSQPHPQKQSKRLE